MRLEDVVFTNVGGLKTACLDRQQLADVLVERAILARSGLQKPILVFSSNGHSVSMTNSDPAYNEMWQQADLIHADGQSIVKASKRFGELPIPERTSTTDMIHDIPMMRQEKLRHFLLGSKAEIVEKCADILGNKYDNFEIAGVHDGYFDEVQELEVIKKINASNADVIWVGQGKPKEQQFCIRNRTKLNVPIIISCGGCYSYITGDYGRAPMFMQNLGFEWLYRVAKDPKKLFWRYLTTNPHAIYCIMKHSFLDKYFPDTKVRRYGKS